MKDIHILPMNKFFISCQKLLPGRLRPTTDKLQSNTKDEALPDLHQCFPPLDKQILTRHDTGLRRVIYNFTPSWFSVIMGTGMVSTLLNTLPYNGRWLYWVSIIIFAVNVFIFAVFCMLSILRYSIYPETFRAMISQPVQSVFLGTFPLGLATIINMVCLVCVPAWGSWSENFAWALWIFDACVSALAALSLPFLLMSSETDTQLSSMTAVWLMPVVTCVVSSGTGAIVADTLSNPQQALWTITVSYVLWGIGICLSMMIYVIYFLRLMLHKLPPKEVIMSVFFPMGPLGSGSFGIMKLGAAARIVFPKTQTLDDSSAASLVYVLGAMTALILWGFGLPWLFFAFSSIIKCRKFPFDLSWWAFTFPLGAYAMGTCQLGRELPSAFLQVLGTILSIVVVLHWIVISIATLQGIISGELFASPALSHVKHQQSGETLSVSAV